VFCQESTSSLDAAFYWFSPSRSPFGGAPSITVMVAFRPFPFFGASYVYFSSFLFVLVRRERVFTQHALPLVSPFPQVNIRILLGSSPLCYAASAPSVGTPPSHFLPLQNARLSLPQMPLLMLHRTWHPIIPLPVVLDLFLAPTSDLHTFVFPPPPLSQVPQRDPLPDSPPFSFRLACPVFVTQVAISLAEPTDLLLLSLFIDLNRSPPDQRNLHRCPRVLHFLAILYANWCQMERRPLTQKFAFPFLPAFYVFVVEFLPPT